MVNEYAKFCSFEFVGGSGGVALAAVKEVLGAIVCALASGVRIEYRGFGSFNLNWHEARVGRNPRTGEAVHVPAKYVPHFLAGKEFREALNERARQEERN